MSYIVNVNGKSFEAKSYDAAKSTLKSVISELAVKMAEPVRSGLYRSPKAVLRVNDDRIRSAAKLVTGVKFPKTAGEVSGKISGVHYAIARK